MAETVRNGSAVFWQIEKRRHQTYLSGGDFKINTRDRTVNKFDDRNQVIRKSKFVQRLPQSKKAPKRLAQGRSSDLPPFRSLKAFSLRLDRGIGRWKQWPKKKERRIQFLLGIVGGTQRPDRPGFSPEFPVKLHE